MKFGKFEIDEFIVIFILFIVLVLAAAILGYRLDSQDKEIEKLKLKLQIEQTKTINKNLEKIEE